MNKQFENAIKNNQAKFDLELDDEAIEQLAFYYEGVRINNKLLHLIGNADPEEFAIRHVLESLYALQFMPEKSFFADLGSGAGLPGIPCLVVREDLSGVFVESKPKKSDFLKKAANMLKIVDRTEVVANQFDETQDPGVSHIMCRAIDGFSKKVPRILKWAPDADVIFFAGENVKKILVRKKIEFKEYLIPTSERRYIYFISQKKTENQDPPKKAEHAKDEPLAETKNEAAEANKTNGENGEFIDNAKTLE